MTTEAKSPYKAKDFASDQDVRWCPGCGDYLILKQVLAVLAEMGIPHEEQCFVSGIGCSSRFPYYVNTYGLHGIHGRAPAIAFGVKAANPDLHLWVITGDGDSLSIGGNHLIHAIRRNLDFNILIFNNGIYGLTKGQYSPTSPKGIKTVTSPQGSLEVPFNPIALALGAGASFVARTHDRDAKHMRQTFRAAADHKGTSVVEILQNCPIFHNGAWDYAVDRKIRADQTVYLVGGEPLIFGENRERAIVVEDGSPVAKLVEDLDRGSILLHDEGRHNAGYAFLLSQMSPPDLPLPVGVFRKVSQPEYATQMLEQENAKIEKFGRRNLEHLLNKGDVIVIGG